MKISSPSRKISARNPSHLGSKSQSSPAGNSSTRLASIGKRGGLTGRSTPSYYGKFWYGKFSVLGCQFLAKPTLRIGNRELPFSALLFELELRFVFFHEALDVGGGTEQAVPLLVVERDRKAAQAVHAHAAFFADLENQVAAAFLDFYFFFQLRQLRFQFLVGWFCHAFVASGKNCASADRRSG